MSSNLIDLSEINCLDVHEMDKFATLEVWELDFKRESMFPFPILTFKENGVWRAINAEQMR